METLTSATVGWWSAEGRGGWHAGHDQVGPPKAAPLTGVFLASFLAFRLMRSLH
jgi:hypothetical protein